MLRGYLLDEDDDGSDVLVEARSAVEGRTPRGRYVGQHRRAREDPVDDELLQKGEREVNDEIARRLDTTGSTARAAEAQKQERARRR